MIRIIVLLFLFSNFSFLQNKDNPEQTKFDFPGYTLKVVWALIYLNQKDK